MTGLGRALVDLLAGRELRGVSWTRMGRLCGDLAKMSPPRYLRSAHDVERGGWRLNLVGAPVERMEEG